MFLLCTDGKSSEDTCRPMDKAASVLPMHVQSNVDAEKTVQKDATSESGITA